MRAWRLPERWPDGGRGSTVARWTRRRAAPAYAPIPDLTYARFGTDVRTSIVPPSMYPQGCVQFACTATGEVRCLVSRDRGQIIMTKRGCWVVRSSWPRINPPSEPKLRADCDGLVDGLAGMREMHASWNACTPKCMQPHPPRCNENGKFTQIPQLR